MYVVIHKTFPSKLDRSPVERLVVESFSCWVGFPQQGGLHQAGYLLAVPIIPLWLCGILSGTFDPSNLHFLSLWSRFNGRRAPRKAAKLHV